MNEDKNTGTDTVIDAREQWCGMAEPTFGSPFMILIGRMYSCQDVIRTRNNY